MKDYKNMSNKELINESRNICSIIFRKRSELKLIKKIMKERKINMFDEVE